MFAETISWNPKKLYIYLSSYSNKSAASAYDDIQVSLSYHGTCNSQYVYIKLLDLSNEITTILQQFTNQQNSFRH